jgi:hypothetical protein
VNLMIEIGFSFISQVFLMIYFSFFLNSVASISPPESFATFSFNEGTVKIDFSKGIGGGKGGGSIFRGKWDKKGGDSTDVAVKFDMLGSSKTRHIFTKAGKPWILKWTDPRQEYDITSSYRNVYGVVQSQGLLEAEAFQHASPGLERLGMPEECDGSDRNLVFEYNGEQLRYPGIVLELLGGQSLKNKLRKSTDLQLTAPLLVEMMDRGFEALKTVWSRGYTHADSHTGNYQVLPEHNSLVILDFGYSEELDEGVSAFINKSRDLRMFCKHFEGDLNSRDLVFTETVMESFQKKFTRQFFMDMFPTREFSDRDWYETGGGDESRGLIYRFCSNQSKLCPSHYNTETETGLVEPSICSKALREALETFLPLKEKCAECHGEFTDSPNQSTARTPKIPFTAPKARKPDITLTVN